MPLAPGKLPFTLMNRIIERYLSDLKDERVVIGPKIGQDTAVIDMGENYLVLKTDPITFITDHIGYYAVNVNANDIATAGAQPKWFLASVLLPEKSTDEALVEKIFHDLTHECKKLGITLVGGHTEITFGLDRPIIVGAMVGEVAKDNLVTTMGGKPGDILLLTKGVPIEGGAIIASAREKELLSRGIPQKIIDQGKQLLFDPGISIMREALLISQNFQIHAMHDPTEGGLAMGIVEMVSNSGCGVIVERENIPIISPSILFCQEFGLDPLSTIASGCLILAASSEDADNILHFARQNQIDIAIIGELTDKKGEYLLRERNGKLSPLKYSQIDEITKIF